MENLQDTNKPVAWYDSVSGWTDFHSFKPTRKPSSPSAEWLPLYATPTQRTWVGLKDEQYLEACKIAEGGNYMVAFQRIQQWLKEKNT